MVAVLTGMFTGVSAAAQEDDTGPGNRAHLDIAATEEMVAAAKSLCGDLFTFSYTDLKAHEAKFGRLTTGEFTHEYGRLFSDIGTMAQEQRVTLTSTATEAAVRVLRDDRAEVLVFLDQTSKREATGEEIPATAMFTATIQRVDGDWKFADIDLYEGK